jgi:hypothetical protein
VVDLKQPSKKKTNKSIQVLDKIAEKRILLTMRYIQILLKHAKDEKLGGQLDATMTAKFFLVVVLNKLLIPTSCHYANTMMVKAVDDLEALKTVDWCNLIFNRLKESILKWQKKSRYNHGRLYTAANGKYLTNFFLIFGRKPWSYCRQWLSQGP